MSPRKLAANRGAGWITDGLAIFRAQPAPYLSASLIVGLLMALPVVSLLIGLVTPVFYGGLLNLLHRQAGGGAPTAGQAFDGFSQPGAFSRLLPIVLVNLAFAFVMVMLLIVLVGSAVLALARGAATPEAEQAFVMAALPSLGLFALIALPLATVFNWIMMLAIPQAMLGQVPGLTALADAARAVLANLAPLLVNLLCLLVLLFVLVLVLMVPFFVIGVLQQHAPALALLIQLPVMAVFTGAVLALYCAVMYQAWRELFADALPPPRPLDQIAV